MTYSGKILVVDDDRSMREFLEIMLTRNGHEVVTVDGGKEAIEILAKQEFDLVITDLKMPKVGGLQVLAAAKKSHSETEVIVVTAFATTETAIAAMKKGAYDYLTKPFKVDEITAVINRAIEKRALVRDNITLREQLNQTYRLEQMVGHSDAMRHIFDLIRKVALTRTSVLILGESGTGKELVARAIHILSERAQKPFVAINCGAIPDNLMESELFGYVRGAFTGATNNKEGLFSAGNGGTVFLDEIAELNSNLQVKLLRTLQERTIKPVGAVLEKNIDVRILAASNRYLSDEVEAGRFRSDLYYRLNVVPITLPPLRERKEDIPILVRHFIRKYAVTSGRQINSITPEAMALLCQYHFPGNVRELENLIERAITLASGDKIDESVFPELRKNAISTENSPPLALPENGLDLDAYVGSIELQILQEALKRTGGNRTEAARLLGISLRSIRYRLSKHGIEKPLGEKDEID